ncbi:endopeptidase [Lysobacter antibioticus]|uniref:endopeptidase n=1 Tax=Lysobacter antibioticus TaxID=84531 RepID=UPI0021BDA75B|nr:endopeptidase [Lysobacter antibioticus]
MSIMSRVLLALLIGLAALVLWQRGSLSAAERARDAAVEQRDSAVAERDNANKIIADERRRADEANAIAAKFEQEKRDAEANGAAVAAGLRAGSLSLRKRWEGCEARMSAAGAGGGEPDAGAADRAESAGRIVRAAAECDAQVRGLQAQVKADRAEVTK